MARGACRSPRPVEGPGDVLSVPEISLHACRGTSAGVESSSSAARPARPADPARTCGRVWSWRGEPDRAGPERLRRSGGLAVSRSRGPERLRRSRGLAVWRSGGPERLRRSRGLAVSRAGTAQAVSRPGGPERFWRSGTVQAARRAASASKRSSGTSRSPVPVPTDRSGLNAPWKSDPPVATRSKRRARRPSARRSSGR